MKNKKWISLAAAVILAVTALPMTAFAAETDGGEEKLTKVTLNEVAHSIFYAPQYVAIEEGYFSEEELEENRIEEYSSWKSLKPICYSLIRGKRLPESFRIVFLMPPSARDRFVSGRVPGLSPDQVGGLYINVQYENHEMICVTGTSMKQFTMDRTLENEWDENVRKFLRKNGVAVS